MSDKKQQNEIDDEFTQDKPRTASRKLKTKKQRKGKPADDNKTHFAKWVGPILPNISNDKLISPGFPVVPSGDRMIIEEVDNSFLTGGSKILIVDVGGKDNSARVARIVAMSPDLYNEVRFPNMFYKVGDLVYFNHLSGNYMRLRVPGKSDLGRYFCLWITDIISKFIAGDEYFAEAEKMIQEHHLAGPSQRPGVAEDIKPEEIPGYTEGESHGKIEDAITVPEGIDIS